MKTLKTLATVILLTIGMACATAAVQKTPTAKVKATVESILTVLRDESLDWKQRQQRLEPIIDRAFDFRSMSQSVLATHWQKATSAERERFVQFFSQYLENTYMKKIETYTDQYVRYGKEKIRGRRAIVDTFIVSDKTEIPVTYKMREDGGDWFAYDVIIEGQSLANNYRTVYSTIIKNEGIGGLLDSLEHSVEEQHENARRSGILME